MITKESIEPVILNFNLGCTAEDHQTECTFDVVAVAQTSCTEEVETWCLAAYGYWIYSCVVGEQCYGCASLISDCWIVNDVEETA